MPKTGQTSASIVIVTIQRAMPRKKKKTCALTFRLKSICLSAWIAHVLRNVWKQMIQMQPAVATLTGSQHIKFNMEQNGYQNPLLSPGSSPTGWLSYRVASRYQTTSWLINRSLEIDQSHNPIPSRPYNQDCTIFVKFCSWSSRKRQEIQAATGLLNAGFPTSIRILPRLRA